MKHLLVPIAAAVASLASQAQAAIPAQRLSEVRQAIQQSQTNPGVSGSRQLTAEERAELRRQVQEQSRRRARP